MLIAPTLADYSVPGIAGGLLSSSSPTITQPASSPSDNKPSWSSGLTDLFGSGLKQIVDGASAGLASRLASTDTQERLVNGTQPLTGVTFFGAPASRVIGWTIAGVAGLIGVGLLFRLFK